MGSLATKVQEMSEEEIMSLKQAWDGEYPSWKIIVWTIDHSFWHAGQLRTMRALYQAKEGRGVPITQLPIFNGGFFVGDN